MVTFFKAYHSNEKSGGFWLDLLRKLRCVRKRKKKSLENFQEECKPIWERRFFKVAKRYLATTFLTDFISIYPNIILQLYYIAVGIARKEFQQYQIYIIFSVLRLLRLSKI